MSRDAIAPVIIVITVLAGGWMMLVEPMLTEITRLEERLVELDGPTISEEQIRDVAEKVEDARDRITGVRQANELASRSSELYARIRDLAKKHKVIVPQIAPGGTARGADDDEHTIHRIDLLIEGTYRDVATFLGAMDSMPGFIRPRGLQIAPIDRDSSRVISATFSCEALQFRFDDPTMLAGGADDAQR